MPLYSLISAEPAFRGVLYTGNINPPRGVDELPLQLIDGHMAHNKHKAYPWHERSFHISSDNVSTNRADQQCTDPRPKVK